MLCVQNEDALHGTGEHWIDFVFLAWKMCRKFAE